MADECKTVGATKTASLVQRHADLLEARMGVLYGIELLEDMPRAIRAVLDRVPIERASSSLEAVKGLMEDKLAARPVPAEVGAY